MDFRHALQTYTVLTIGDGLVTVIPALMISISGGLIITRANSDRKLGAEVHRQLFGAWAPLMLASGVLVVLAALPGLPAIPFLGVGGALGFWAWKKRKLAAIANSENSPVAQRKAVATQERLEAALKADPLAIEVGPSLALVVQGGSNSELLDRLSTIRLQIALQSGYLVPPVRVSDNVTLPPHSYTVQVRGVEVSRFDFMPGHELAIASGPPEPGLEGKPAVEPAFGLPALWVSRERSTYAQSLGYTVVDTLSVMGTHFAEIVRRYAHELFTRQDAKSYCDRIAQEQPKLVEELVPKHLVTVQRVLQNLLREQVSIRDATSVLEAIGEALITSRNPVLITEYVRQQIRRLIIAGFLKNDEIAVYFLNHETEQTLEAAVDNGETNSVLTMAPQQAKEIVDHLKERLDRDEPAVLVTSPGVRHFLRKLTEISHPNLTVLSQNEIPPNVTVLSLGVL